MKKYKKLLAIVTSILLMAPVTHASDGWGEEQSKGTLRGLLWGGLLGGVVGHQHGKQKEGILIGSMVGSVLGNKSGAGKDSRAMEYTRSIDQNELNRQRLQQQREARYQAKLAAEREAKARTVVRHAPTSHVTIEHVDAEIIAARQRVEALEKQVQQEQERVQASQAREAMLQQIREREHAALKQLEHLKSFK